MPGPSHCPYRARATVVDASSEAGRAELPMRNKRCGCWTRILTSVSHHWRRCQSTRYTAMNHSQCLCLFPSHFPLLPHNCGPPLPRNPWPSRCPLMHLNGPSHSIKPSLSSCRIRLPICKASTRSSTSFRQPARRHPRLLSHKRLDAFDASEHAARTWDLLDRGPVPRPWLSVQMPCCIV